MRNEILDKATTTDKRPQYSFVRCLGREGSSSVVHSMECDDVGLPFPSPTECPQGELFLPLPPLAAFGKEQSCPLLPYRLSSLLRQSPDLLLLPGYVVVARPIGRKRRRRRGLGAKGSMQDVRTYRARILE